VVGLENVDIGDTVADLENAVALPPITIDEPTLDMLFRINDSPFSGLDGAYVTSRQLRDRLMKELESNVALRVQPSAERRDEFNVSGRGLLHLSILIENMRREGFELSVGKPRVINKAVNGQIERANARTDRISCDRSAAQLGRRGDGVGRQSACGMP
jgi:GTP-binding protein